MMRVCHLTSIHKRYDIRIFQKLCRSLAKKYDVTLIINDSLPNEVKDNVKIISTGIVYKNRFHRFMNRNKQLLKQALELNADVYHLHDPDLITIGLKLKKIGYRVIFDSHEDIPMQIREKTWIPRPIRKVISQIYESYEKRKLRKMDSLISVTPHIVERLIKINPNTHMITNYPLIRDFKKDYFIGTTFVIAFAGGIDESWNHELIIKAIKDIPDIRYIIAGPKNEIYLNKLKRLDGWNKVVYLGFISKNEVEELYDKANIGIALHNALQTKGVGTLGVNKVFEFMEAGLPYICTNYPIWTEFTKKYDMGLTIEYNNIKEIIDSINYFKNMSKDNYIRMSNNARKASEMEFNWDTQESKLFNIYSKFEEKR